MEENPIQTAQYSHNMFTKQNVKTFLKKYSQHLIDMFRNWDLVSQVIAYCLITNKALFPQHFWVLTTSLAVIWRKLFTIQCNGKCCKDHIHYGTLCMWFGAVLHLFHKYMKPEYFSGINCHTTNIKCNLPRLNPKIWQKAMNISCWQDEHRRIHLKQNFRTCCWIKSKCSSL